MCACACLFGFAPGFFRLFFVLVVLAGVGRGRASQEHRGGQEAADKQSAHGSSGLWIPDVPRWWTQKLRPIYGTAATVVRIPSSNGVTGKSPKRARYFDPSNRIGCVHR